MKWSSIKNIMVWFLIFMNLAMLAIITATSINKAYIPQEVVASSLSVIRQSGFEIADDIFPGKYYTLPTYRAQFYSASDLSELFFEKQIAFRTDGDSLVGTQGRAVLTVNDNFFSYDSGYSAKEDFSPKELRHALEKTGFDMKDTVYDEKTLCFYKMYNGSNLFNMSLEAKIDRDGEICYVKAHWPKTLIEGEKRKLSFIESSAKLKKAFPNGGKIESIELGYSLHALGGDNFLFTPAWRASVNGEPKIIE